MGASPEALPMQRYYFHFVSTDDAVFDQKGIELADFAAAYNHACELVREVRTRLPEAGEGWWIDISDGVATPTTVVPTMVAGARTQKLGASPLRRRQ
jgi:Domain of unknown function (DUF6894)